MSKMTFVLLMIFNFSGLLFAQTTYYIDPSGSDANGNGTSENPWRTLYKACNTVKTSGSTIYVNPGSYSETLKANLAIGVNITGAGVTSVIRPSYSSDDHRDGAILLSSFNAAGINGNQSISYIKLDGTASGTKAISCLDRGNINIHHCTIVDFIEGGICFEGYSDDDNNNVVHDCIINDCGCRDYEFSAAICLYSQAGCLIYNNTFDQTGRAAGLNGNIIGGLSGVKGLKIHDNTFTRNNYEGTNWQFFIELWYLSDECEVYNNTFNGNSVCDFCDITKGSGTYGLKIHDNNYLVSAPCAATNHGIQAINLELHGNSDPQFHLQYIYIYDNHFKNVSNGIWLDAADLSTATCYVDHVYIYNNLFEKVGTTDNPYSSIISVNSYVAPNPYVPGDNVVWDQVEIFNNTMVAGTYPVEGIYWHIIGAATNVKIRNNIIQGSRLNPIIFAEVLSGSSITNLSIENNLYYNNSPNSVAFGAVTITNKTEQFNLVANPVFVSSNDFHLQSNSPAVDAGINVGFPFSGTAPDIGAYESNFTGIESIENNSTIKVYPNPVSDEFMIEIKGNDDKQDFKILNTTSQTVFKGTLSEKIMVQTTNFSPGVYLIILEKSRPYEFKKIVKL